MSRTSGLESLASCSTQLFPPLRLFTFLCLAGAHCVKFTVSDTGVYKNLDPKKRERGKKKPPES